MAYAIYTDVLSEFKDLAITATTIVTIAEVTEYIAQTENIVNAQLSQIYVTPVTDTMSTSIIKNIVIWFVAHRVQEVMKLRSGEELDSKNAENLYQKAQDLLDKIIDKKLLSEATLNSSTNTGVEDFNSKNSIRAEFDLSDGGTNNDQSIGEKNFW